MKTPVILSFLLLLLSAPAWAQTKAELEKERASIQREIDAVKKSLAQTTKNKKETLGQLSLIQKKLRLREAQIRNINKQINLIQGDIIQSNRDINKLRKELDTLKSQYQKSVVYAYMNRSNYDFINFLFSSTSFNDALKRIAYLRSYRNYREQQAENINNTQSLLRQKIVGLNENRKKKSEVLVEENKQRSVLEEEKDEKNTVVSKLKLREKELGRELAAKRKQDQKLANAIASAIRRAREEAAREAKAKATTAAKKTEESSVAKTTPGTKEATVAKKTTVLSPLESDPASRKLSDDFEKNRGSLPWPVEMGKVSMGFGIQHYLDDDKLTIDNHGITIETEPGKSVKTIFSGEVAAVMSVGPVQAVIVRHGKYFSTYSNLSSASVSKGQKVTTGQVVGRAADKGDGTADIELLISNDRDQYFDPEKWLR